MSTLVRYIIDAVVLEGRSPSQLARDHKLARSWIYTLLARFRKEGYPGLEPRSRRPRSCPQKAEPRVEAEVLRLRRELSEAGLDAGPQTLAHHLIGLIEPVPSVSTIWRILKRHSLTSALVPPSSASSPGCPTRPGRSTPRPGSWRTGLRSSCSTSRTTALGSSSTPPPSPLSRRPTSSTPSIQLQISSACLALCSATTPLSSLLSRGEAKFCSSWSWSVWASWSNTPAPTIPRLAARSSACTKLSSAFYANRLRPAPSLSCSFSSTLFAATTTSVGHIGRSTGKHRSRSSMP